MKNENNVKLEWWNGEEWIPVSAWINEELAWASLGGDEMYYRTTDMSGKVLREVIPPKPDSQ